MSRRHEDTIETIWILLKNYRDSIVSSDATLSYIEQTLTLLESRIQDDLSEMEDIYKKGHHV